MFSNIVLVVFILIDLWLWLGIISSARESGMVIPPMVAVALCMLMLLVGVLLSGIAYYHLLWLSLLIIPGSFLLLTTRNGLSLLMALSVLFMKKQ
ncbi:hypothetical protein [Endozoicomonas sp. SCSIO W0465]|uniref:hypothetical protein n=1 Tax=Endozoicomonas sp. SCSIO W0465 TaxID=2918516 RepID=UPI002074B451|nr:hypothetical protein [Endozoicomonas sp. SCSIO W0465]USE36433.1 hypothetical protein MJO57_31200 [Endozoicomonas sp. SCSIO W0465]